MKDDPPEEDDVKRYLKKQKELTWRYSQHIADRSIRNANQPPSYDGSEECIDFDCNPDHSQAAFLPDDVIEPGEVTAPMQDDPPEDVIEDDDFFGEEVEVTAPAPGMTQGTYVGEYGDSGILPEDGVDGIPNTELHFSHLQLYCSSPASFSW